MRKEIFSERLNLDKAEPAYIKVLKINSPFKGVTHFIKTPNRDKSFPHQVLCLVRFKYHVKFPVPTCAVGYFMAFV